MSETNTYHLALVRKGMSEKQVLQIMHKPYSYESFEVGEDVYDVWFYVTRTTGLDQTRMVPQNLTPRTFKNGVLAGTGYSWYYYAMKEQSNAVEALNPHPKPKSQADEDKAFERVLRAPNGTPAPQKSGIEKALEAPKSEEKLPNNVHIISDNELTQGSCPKRVCGEDRFRAISKGMTEKQVIGILGEPVSYETFEFEGNVFDVWFYDTVASKSGKPSIVPQNRTPLTFQNAVLISLSDEEFFVIKQQAIISAAKKSPSPSQEPRRIPHQKKSIFKPYVPKTPMGVSGKLFTKVRKGMTEDEIMILLGSTTDQESYSLGSDVYDIWFYEVDSGKQTKSIPLTFKNGMLIGTTEEEYQKVQKAAEPDQVDGYDRKDERMQEEESEQNFNYW
jgi:outer membrane protein assembly factor BamE (lipoprotein component of BamABCDE complex)